MDQSIDIIVRDADSTEVKLIAETKLVLTARDKVEASLKRCMSQLSCPVGLVITPQTMWVYADRYTSEAPTSIELVGEFAIGDLLQFESNTSSAAKSSVHFERTVQSWLENLPVTWQRKRLSDGKPGSVLSRYILPALETGEVRAAVPRG